MAQRAQQGLVVFPDQNPNRRAAGQALCFDHPALIGQYSVARRGQRRDMRHLATGDECIRGMLRQTEQVFEPAGDHLFDNRGRRRTGVSAGILIPGRGQPVGGDRHRDRAADYPAEKAPTGAVQQAFFGIIRELVDHLQRWQAVISQCLV